MNFIALDFETANMNRASACALGVVVVENNVITDKLYWLIKPNPCRFDWQCIQVHGIQPEDVADAPSFRDVWAELAPIMDGKNLVAHNAAFDMSVLRAELDRIRAPYPSVPYTCSVNIAKKAWEGLDNYKLNTVSHYLAISLNHHEALSDAQACAKIMISAAEECGATCFHDLHHKLSCTPGALYPGGYSAASKNAKKRK